MPWLCFQETPKSGLNSGPEQLCALWLAAQHSEPVFVGIKQEYYHQPHWQTVKMKRGHGNVCQGPKDRPCRAFNTLKPGPQEPLPAGTRERKAESTDGKHLALFPPQTVGPAGPLSSLPQRQRGTSSDAEGILSSGGRPQTSSGTAPGCPLERG